jgi:hypothetical protein
MAERRFDPTLNKKRLLVHADYTAYTVNGLAVRNASQPDEEFGNFAAHDEFPDVIRKHELWVSEKLAPKEGVFFLANALARLARQAAGATDQAYDDGIAVERVLRERINGIEFRDGRPHKQVPRTWFGVTTRLTTPRAATTTSIHGFPSRRSGWKTEWTIAKSASLSVTSTWSGG